MNLLALILVSLLAPAPASGSKAVEEAQAEVERLIRASGAEVAVAFRTLDARREILIRPDDVFHAASTMKVPVMMELFGQAEAGNLNLDAPLPITNEFHSIVDGSPYQLDPADDSDAELYQAVGQERPLRELCQRMITASSNLAANLLIERLGPKNIQRRVDALGAPGMKVLRGVEDGKAYERGWNNTTTARALLTLLEKLAKGEAAGPEATREMIEILRRQEFTDAIPAGLPRGTPVAHKTGEITKIHHDAAIVFGDRPFVLVVLVRGLEDRTESASLMAAITRVLWQAVHAED